MTISNPYVATLVEMGYDEADCRVVASAGVKKTFPLNIHGRVFDTQEEYDEALADFLNGLWLTSSWKTTEFKLKLTTDVWLFGMNNLVQRLRTNWYLIASTINSVD